MQQSCSVCPQKYFFNDNNDMYKNFVAVKKGIAYDGLQYFSRLLATE